jgi:hypothetical protein
MSNAAQALAVIPSPFCSPSDYEKEAATIECKIQCDGEEITGRCGGKPLKSWPKVKNECNFFAEEKEALLFVNKK